MENRVWRISRNNEPQQFYGEYKILSELNGKSKVTGIKVDRKIMVKRILHGRPVEECQK